MKHHREFQHVYRRVKAAHSKGLTLFYLPSEESKKVGFTATKKVGNAVKRNRSKRRMRALFQEFSHKLKSGTYILVAKESLNDTPYQQLQKDYVKMLKRLKGYSDA